jgi:hypothetical protein
VLLEPMAATALGHALPTMWRLARMDRDQDA